jgi:hypothetical protein
VYRKKQLHENECTINLRMASQAQSYDIWSNDIPPAVWIGSLHYTQPQIWFCDRNEHKDEEDLLTSWFATAETVCGTQQLHAFMSAKKGILNTTIYSDSPQYTENCEINDLKDMTELEVNTSMHDNFWWL